jgi:hypothetical protein
MLPRGSLRNSGRGEFSRFALSDKENLFVLTYTIYILNYSTGRQNEDASFPHRSIYPLSDLMIFDDLLTARDDRQTALFITN